MEEWKMRRLVIMYRKHHFIYLCTQRFSNVSIFIDSLGLSGLNLYTF